MSRIVLRRGNDQVVSLLGLRATETQEYLNTATVVATMLDSRGVAIPSLADIPMVYVPDSNGDYEWVIESATMMLQKNVEYSLEIRAVQEGLNYRRVDVVSVVDEAP